MGDAVITFIVSVLGSGVIAATVAARAERKHQFREPMIAVASDFAGTTMNVLAALRRFKPPKPGERHHRNAPLIADPDLRLKRYEKVEQASDHLRDLRGRVRLHFPGEGGEQSEVSALADEIVGDIRDATDECEKFWTRCDQRPKELEALKEKFNATYHQARDPAWDKLDDFCNRAATSAWSTEVRTRFKMNARPSDSAV